MEFHLLLLPFCRHRLKLFSFSPHTKIIFPPNPFSPSKLQEAPAQEVIATIQKKREEPQIDYYMLRFLVLVDFRPDGFIIGQK
ncbi:hypothetical protein Pfo_031107 [Paulownia fortunei]|nr:hypothetical protein Pfo_031107 [Paulownia fortunei]